MIPLLTHYCLPYADEIHLAKPVCGRTLKKDEDAVITLGEYADDMSRYTYPRIISKRWLYIPCVECCKSPRLELFRLSVTKL